MERVVDCSALFYFLHRPYQVKLLGIIEGGGLGKLTASLRATSRFSNTEMALDMVGDFSIM